MRHALAIVIALSGLAGLAPRPVDGYSAINTQKGFDTCAAKTQAQMQAWFSNSPYYNTVAYIGGSNRSCSQPNLTAAWVAAVHTQGWGLLPTWVGPQAPDSCNSHAYASYISTNTTTARTQGIQEATSAYNAASALGMDLSKVPLVYDIEAYNGGTTCRAAVKAFIDGWSDYLFKEPGETFGRDATPGVYGSACGSYIDDFYLFASRPSFIWFGYWNGNQSTTSIPSCMVSTHWSGQLRHKQYISPHNETWGGVAITMDTDCSYGPLFDDVNLLSGPCG